MHSHDASGDDLFLFAGSLKFWRNCVSIKRMMFRSISGTCHKRESLDSKCMRMNDLKWLDENIQFVSGLYNIISCIFQLKITAVFMLPNDFQTVFDDFIAHVMWIILYGPYHMEKCFILTSRRILCNFLLCKLLLLIICVNDLAWAHSFMLIRLRM